MEFLAAVADAAIDAAVTDPSRRYFMKNVIFKICQKKKNHKVKKN
jgi:hypothetical protein